ncbi:DUF3108 domain-containing protein [Pseudochrobactrum kiredjianiae]|uniref:DUF3108 domain-containing protein n=1 Tax=Pseudochrobactrum kiredjianiae TaxID=386305 RepID=A0ABW3V872_9HYPH|nr:DUF3108 domain-containing protein [Pseudochrobactrum kiredjianiae]MDM7849517.1 DUF3108 domain-containing protein [Pseudochrobactrum kiredjianiae]
MLLTDIAAKTQQKTVAKRLIGTIFLTAVSLLPATAYAADSGYRTEYGIYIFGMTIARSEMNTKMSDTSYTLDGEFHSSGLARIFDSTKGSITIRGAVLNQGTAASVQPASYLTTYRSGKKHKRTSISFKNGSVSAYDNQPPINKVAPWAELGANDLKAVFDPISSMMITSPSAAAVCNRTLQIFDGQTRAQIRLSPAGTERLSVKGFDGTAITCNARFVPVSGYEKDKKSVRYLADKSKITISFASLNTDNQGAGIYAPVGASVGTQIGTVKVRATRFEKTK